MRVLSIDPGYGRCGVAIVEKAYPREVVLYSSCIETAASLEFLDRLRAVVDACETLIDTYAPECLAMEKLYLSKNQKTAMRVAEVRGALLSLAHARSLPVSEYTPNEIKSATTGFGGADKKAIVRMVHTLVAIEKPIRHDDEYDAIAIGITHLARARER